MRVRCSRENRSLRAPWDARLVRTIGVWTTTSAICARNSVRQMTAPSGFEVFAAPDMYTSPMRTRVRYGDTQPAIQNIPLVLRCVDHGPNLDRHLDCNSVPACRAGLADRRA